MSFSSLLFFSLALVQNYPTEENICGIITKNYMEMQYFHSPSS